MQKIEIILILIVLIATGCSALKKKAEDKRSMEGSYNIEQFISAVKERNITNNSFYIAKADIKATLRDFNQNLVISIKYKKPDSALFIIRAKIGLEVGRVLITDDTVIINDRLNKRVILSGPEYFKKKYGLEPKLLNMIFGDFLLNPEPKEKEMNCVENSGEIYFSEKENVFYMKFDCDGKKLTEASIENLKEGKRIDFNFSEFTKKENLLYPVRSKIFVSGEKIKVDLRIEKIDPQWNGEINFVMNSGYKRKVLK